MCILYKLFCVRNRVTKSSELKPGLSESVAIVKEKAQRQGWRAIMPLAEFKDILRWLNIHTAHLAWSQCSSTSRFSAVLFGCTADCKACFFEAKKSALWQNPIFFSTLRCRLMSIVKFIKLREMVQDRSTTHAWHKSRKDREPAELRSTQLSLVQRESVSSAVHVLPLAVPLLIYLLPYIVLLFTWNKKIRHCET